MQLVASLTCYKWWSSTIALKSNDQDYVNKIEENHMQQNHDLWCLTSKQF